LGILSGHQALPAAEVVGGLLEFRGGDTQPQGSRLFLEQVRDGCLTEQREQPAALVQSPQHLGERQAALI